MEDTEALDPTEYIRQKEEYAEQRDEFMRKQLRRVWPICILRILGTFQLLISLAILGVDLPIILMFAPRWQIFAGCWTFVFGFIACVSTIHSTRKMTWLKLKWTVALNILAGIAAAIMVAFDILYLVNPYVCVIASGCNYLSYTYSAANSLYTGEVIVGIALFLTVFIFLIIFIKYGVGGVTIFENIQDGRAAASFNPIVPPHGTIPVQPHPATGPGTSVGGPPPPRPPSGNMLRYPPPRPPSGYMQRYPPPPPPPGYIPRYPPPGPAGMMTRPPGPMMMYGPPGSMMVPDPRVPMQGYYRQPGPYPTSAQRYQN